MTGGRKGTPVADPARHSVATPVGPRPLLEWFAEAERLAGVAHQAGRGAYGIRRVAADAAKEVGISREALKVHGDWSETQTPDGIFAEQGAEHAREEA